MVKYMCCVCVHVHGCVWYKGWRFYCKWHSIVVCVNSEEQDRLSSIGSSNNSHLQWSLFRTWHLDFWSSSTRNIRFLHFFLTYHTRCLVSTDFNLGSLLRREIWTPLVTPIRSTVTRVTGASCCSCRMISSRLWEEGAWCGRGNNRNLCNRP